LDSRHVRASMEPLSFEREVVGILLEEPALAEEFGERISAERFRNDLYRRIYERIVGAGGTVTSTGDVFGLFGEDQASLDALAALGARDRSSAVRYSGSEERRAHLERVVERLQQDEALQRYRELSRSIDEELSAGRPVSSQVRDEFDALVARLKR
ncbi:MAG: hypothetical protein WCD38_02410, partial [Candidatus Tumulicola sp.]